MNTAHTHRRFILLRLGAFLSVIVLLGICALAYLVVSEAYTMYPQFGYQPVFSALGILMPLPFVVFFAVIALRIHALTMRKIMTLGAACMWAFTAIFFITWLLEGFLIGEAPGAFMYVCVGTLILSSTIAYLLTLGGRCLPAS